MGLGAEERRELGVGAYPKTGSPQGVTCREGVTHRDTVPVHARDTGSHDHRSTGVEVNP